MSQNRSTAGHDCCQPGCTGLAVFGQRHGANGGDQHRWACRAHVALLGFAPGRDAASAPPLPPPVTPPSKAQQVLL